MRVLAVGPGPGEIDHDFLNEIVKVGAEELGEEYSVIYQVVEPNMDHIENLRSSVLRNEYYKKINFLWYHGGLGEFINKFTKENEGAIDEEERQYDFVHYARVFYYVDSVSALDKTYNILLRKHGFVAVVGENEGSFWSKMMVFLNDHEMFHEVFRCSGPVSMAYFLPGWISQAKKNKWKYEAYTDQHNFDVTLMFDKNSQIGNYLIDFTIHVKEARKSVKKEILDDFFKFLNENVKEEEIEEDGKRFVKKYFPCVLATIIITKE